MTTHEGQYTCWQCLCKFDEPFILPSTEDGEDIFDILCPHCGSIEVTDVDTYDECKRNNTIDEENEDKRLFKNEE